MCARALLPLLLLGSCARAGFFPEQACGTDQDCPLGLRCRGGRCVVPADAGDAGQTGDARDAGDAGDARDADAGDGGACAGADPHGRCLVSCPPPPAPDPCATSTCYYIAASGGSDASPGTSPLAPWASFAHAWSELGPGDTLVLLDGVYKSALAPTISGTAAAPIRIRAANDGGAIIDGEGVRRPCSFSKISHLEVVGIHCRNHQADAVNNGLFFIGQASAVTARRITVEESNADSLLVHVYASSDVLIEDAAAWGTSGGVFVSFASNRVTFRRCWAELPAKAPVAGSASGFLLSQTSDSLIENCIVALPAGGAASYQGPAYSIWASEDDPSNRNRLLGNPGPDLQKRWFLAVMSKGVRIEGNRYANNVSIAAGHGMFQRADADLLVERQTIADLYGTCHALRAMSPVSYEPSFAITGSLVNSICLGGALGLSVGVEEGIVPTFTHDYNLLQGVAEPFETGLTASAHERVNTKPPSYDTARFGPGAYLIAPADLANAGSTGGPIGAEVLFRYQGGSLSCVRLWPWPMEQRILAEHGVSVTWATNHGLWKTLAGVYPPAK